MAFIFSHKKSFTRWAIAVFTDYEVILTQFMRDDGWDFETFKNKLTECNTALLHHCAVGKGKTTEEQQLYMTKVLLGTARDFWLYYPLVEFFTNNVCDDDWKPDSEPLYRVKQMLAGFYLTYSMYKTQSYLRNKVKISMDSQDLLAYYYFNMHISKCKKLTEFMKIQILYLMLDLTMEDAFSFCSESSEYGLNIRTRLRQGVIGSKLFDFNEEVKAIHHSISLPHHSNEIQTNLVKFEALKGKIIRMALGANNGSHKRVKDSEVNAVAPSSSETVSLCSSGSGSNMLYDQLDLMCETGLQDVLNATISCSAALDKPIFTIPNILGNSSIDRTIMYEASKRNDLQLQRKNQKPTLSGGESTFTNKQKGIRAQTTDSDEDADVDTAFDDEEEIEFDVGSENVKKGRRIPPNSQNLMNYIRGLSGINTNEPEVPKKDPPSKKKVHCASSKKS